MKNCTMDAVQKRFRIHGNGSLVKEAFTVSGEQKEHNRLKIRSELGISYDDFIILSVGELSDRKKSYCRSKSAIRIKEAKLLS